MATARTIGETLAFLCFLAVQDPFLPGSSFKGLLSRLFSKALSQTEQQAEVVDASQEGFEEGVDVSR